MLIVVGCVNMLLGVVFAEDNALKSGTVRGRITDLTPAQNPIEDVEVKIVAQGSGKEWTTKTNADGEYEQSMLPTGRYLISISKAGYEDRVGKPVAVVDSGDHFISLKMTKKSKIKPPFEPKPSRMNSVLKPRIESLRQHLSESIGERYDLDPATINTLRLSIPGSVETALEQDSRNILFFGKASEGSNVALIKMLLSHPVCKAAFTRHLSEAQLQDYLEFTEAREIRDRQAVVHWITVSLDKELSLRKEQREKVVQSLLDTAESELFPTSMNALQLSSQQAAQLMHYRLNISLDGVLSEAQSKVWEGLVNAKAQEKRIVIVDLPKADIRKVVEDEKRNERKNADVNIKRPFIRKAAPKFVNIEKEVKIVINEVMIDPPEKLPPWIEINADKAESPEHMRVIAEAKLAAHTELLGTLDERGTRRLALVTKGVAQEHIEARDKDSETMDEFWRHERTNIDITNHPLYQQTIKDVLSEEAFAAYSEHQTERTGLHQQALRDLVVACMDMQLLLDDTQRETLETSASQLIPTPLEEKTSSEFMFFQLFPQTINFDILTPWQQGEFERVLGPIARGR
jgi:hypothetical protein